MLKPGFAGAALGLASLLAPSSMAIGEEPSPLYFEVEVQGPLRPETSRALARLFGRNVGAQLYHLAETRGTTADVICNPQTSRAAGLDPLTCAREIHRTVTQVEDLAAHQQYDDFRVVPMFSVGDDSFALVKWESVSSYSSSSPPGHWASSPISPSWAGGLRGLDAGGGLADVIAVPLDDSFLAGKEFARLSSPFDRFLTDPEEVKILSLPGIGAAGVGADAGLFPGLLAYNPNPDDEVALIERDVAALGYSAREFRTDLSAEETRELLRTVAADPAARTGVPHTVPRQSFAFIHPASVTFEAATGECAPPVEDWPLPVHRVASMMCFNRRVREHLSLGPVRRSRILVVDSGLSAELARDPTFARGLYVEPSERLTPPTLLQDSIERPKCVDANGNDYFSDVYGAGPWPSDPSTDCRKASFPLDQLAPIENPPLSEQSYFPGHGGFVAGLALGGSELLEAFPQITDYVGITFFRVTREDRHSRVKTESIDLDAALRYAGRIRADVVNLSLRTAEEGPFKDLSARQPELFLVTSAGNDRENLDEPAPENLPASLDDPNDQILVVGALQHDHERPWWPGSAHSTQKVHLAAPGAEIWSYGMKSQRVCSSGTSAAAPLVSFAAATLRALGLPDRRSVRGRILASTDHQFERLGSYVAEGRRLNVEAALDVFVDRVEIELADGRTETLRGWIVPSTMSLLVVCADAAESVDLRRMGGHIDLSRLWTWRRVDSSRGRFFHRHSSRGPYRTDECRPPAGELTMRLLSGEEVQTGWSQVQSILPTPFRAVETEVLGLTSRLLADAPDPDSEAFSWCSLPQLQE